MDSNPYFINKETQDAIQEKMISFRRRIHKNPELSLKEFETAQFVVDTLTEAGFKEIHTQIGITGVVAVLRGALDESILLRADMDALPINEVNSLEFKSIHEGVMHACGHDGHVAILLGIALTMHDKVKNGLKLQKGIKFCFQPGEEGAHGAKKMIMDSTKYDIMESAPRVINCFGFHIASGFQLDYCYYQIGAITAYSTKWEIEVQGRGGHAMAPEETLDALQIGSLIVVALYQIRGRNVNQSQACTISVGTFHSGQAVNVISDKASISGTVRTVRVEEKNNIFERMQKICDGAAVQYGCQVKLTLTEGYRAVINNPSLEPVIESALKKVVKIEKATMGLASEDFSEFADLRPSAYIAIGAALRGSLNNNISSHPHHSPEFDFDEKALLVGFKALLSIIESQQQ